MSTTVSESPGIVVAEAYVPAAATPPTAVLCANDHIAIHFQPQIALATGRVVGVEALARWEGAASGGG